jgi:hypothetical protein
MTIELDYTDGNSLAGPLAEIFAVDITTIRGRCAGCDAVGPVAELRVYGPGPGWVARCPHCDDVMLRFVRGPERAWLDLRGSLNLEITLSDS